MNEPRSYAPERATPDERAQWTEAERQAYDFARTRHHSNMPVILTPEVRRILRDTRLQLQANVHSYGTVCGAVITGPATYGKTTLLEEIGRQYETWFRTQFPPENPDEAALVIPVVKVGLPEKATTKSLNIAIAEFYGAALSRRQTTRDEYQEIIRARVAAHHTRLIIIDDIHYLNRKARRNKQGQRLLNDQELAALISINNHLKSLADELGVTFIFGGINVEDTGLFDEGNRTDTVFSQIGGRMARHDLTGFPHGSDEWKEVVRSFENELCLDHHVPGTLERLANYLHHRTNGSIGSLKNLLKLAALRAMIMETERVDFTLLQKLKSDRNAEENFQRHDSLYQAGEPS
ncbi:ATP-binding protein [Deinococcus sp. Arct2-2]|uniref:ATP-binding protein n=1 Tax=Deinococcus sp. Arct2-2 TaxID=2568653 RepID=UPI001454BA84|nr:ATP-binding protein [Deinococcus sp. Arct2-2]